MPCHNITGQWASMTSDRLLCHSYKLEEYVAELFCAVLSLCLSGV